jgi:hypothetical protein
MLLDKRISTKNMAKQSTVIMAGVVFLVLGFVLAIFLSGGMPGVTTGGIIQISQDQEEKVTCPDDLTTNVDVRSVNPENASLDYALPSHTVGYTKNGQFIASGTVSSADGSYDTIDTNGECGATINLYSFNNANSSAVSKKGVLLQGPATQTELVVPRQSSLEFRALDDALNNITQVAGSATAFGADITTSTQTINSGDTKTFFIRVRPQVAQTSWGSDEVQNIICGDFNTAKFSKPSVTLSGPGVQELSTLPSFCVSDGSGDKAWSITPISRKEGYRELVLTLAADLGDPGASDDVVLKFYEGSYYQSNDGSIKGGIASDNLAAIGITDTKIIIDVA